MATAPQLAGPFEVIGRVDDDGWVERRLTGVGASEVAVMLGEHPKFGGGGPACLWAAKTGGDDLDFGFADDQLAHWGHVLEPVIIQQFATNRYAGWPAWAAGEHLRSTEHPWALATLDAWTEHPTLGPIPLECKTVSPWIADQWEERAPIAYWWQVQHQLLVTGARAGVIAALVGGQALMYEVITRDDLAQRRLKREGARFWACVLEDRVPVHVPTLGSARALYPAGRGETGEVALTGQRWVELDEERERLKGREARAKKRVRELEAQLREAIGRHAMGRLDNGVAFTCKTQQRGTTQFRQLRRKAPRE